MDLSSAFIPVYQKTPFIHIQPSLKRMPSPVPAYTFSGHSHISSNIYHLLTGLCASQAFPLTTTPFQAITHLLKSNFILNGYFLSLKCLNGSKEPQDRVLVNGSYLFLQLFFFFFFATDCRYAGVKDFPGPNVESGHKYK